KAPPLPLNHPCPLENSALTSDFRGTRDTCHPSQRGARHRFLITAPLSPLPKIAPLPKTRGFTMPKFRRASIFCRWALPPKFETESLNLLVPLDFQKIAPTPGVVLPLICQNR